MPEIIDEDESDGHEIPTDHDRLLERLPEAPEGYRYIVGKVPAVNRGPAPGYKQKKTLQQAYERDIVLRTEAASRVKIAPALPIDILMQLMYEQKKIWDLSRGKDDLAALKMAKYAEMLLPYTTPRLMSNKRDNGIRDGDVSTLSDADLAAIAAGGGEDTPGEEEDT